jgi:cytochrome c peroxidase
MNFPPAPKLGVDGKIDPRKGNESEMRGQALFFGKANCVSCHQAPYYTDNLMHDLQTERFYKPRKINGLGQSKHCGRESRSGSVDRHETRHP